MIDGGQQADIYLPGPGEDSSQCGDLENDEDHVSYEDVSAGLTVDMRAGRVTGSESGTDRIQATCFVTGSAGDDMLIGTAGHNHLGGGPGDDVLVGDPSGDSGHDFLQGDGGDDVIYGGAERAGDGTNCGDERNYCGDRLYGDSADREITAGGNDTIYGAGDSDLLVGEGGNDQLFGGHDGDVLRDFLGRNTLDGGPGADDCNSVASGDDANSRPRCER